MPNVASHIDSFDLGHRVFCHFIKLRLVVTVNALLLRT